MPTVTYNVLKKRSKDTLGEFMTKIRVHLNLNQKQLSELLFVTQGSISKFEHDKLLPTLDVWFCFCEITKTNPNSFWDFYQKPASYEKESEI